MKKLFKFVLLVSLIAFIIPIKDLQAGKTKGFPYSDIILEIQASGVKSIAFATYDQRPAIVDGTRQPDFAGYLRNGVGMAYPTATTSLLPLADVMSEVFANSFSPKGFDTKVVKTAFTETIDEIIANCKNTEADVFVILTLDEWHSDGYGGNAEIKYNIMLKVYNKEGNILSEKEAFAEKENIGFSKKKAWEFLKQETRKFFKAKMEELFNSEEVLNSIK